MHFTCNRSSGLLEEGGVSLPFKSGSGLGSAAADS